MLQKKKMKWLVRLLIVFFILINLVAFFHAYKFTHFSSAVDSKTEKPEKLSIAAKLKTLLLGVSNPRPANTKLPETAFETIVLQSNKKIECWLLRSTLSGHTDSSKGTVILFHGYGGDKSSMLDKAAVLNKLGYNCLLVDFMGSGGSEGNITTIGFKEAAEVKTAVDYLFHTGEKKIYLFGTSMGAVAIMKALNDYHTMQPNGIIIECPFGSMYKTVCARFNNMHAPIFPMAGLLVFWGGIQNGFWAFGHNPIAYAKNIGCPTLLLYGEIDSNVSREEIDAIYANLNGSKTLRTYPMAGHENYLIQYGTAWTNDVAAFLTQH